MEDPKIFDANISIINEDLIKFANANNIFYKQNVHGFMMNMLSKTKIQHIAWHIFHSFSVIYPDEPTAEEQLRTKNFIKKITNNLGIICSSCNSKNKDTFIANYDTDLAVSSKTELIIFFLNYHKTVNTSLRPKNHFRYEPDNYTIEFIVDRYTTTDYISLIDTTYNVNLFKLFQLNSMDNFFVLFHKNVKETISRKERMFDMNIVFSILQEAITH